MKYIIAALILGFLFFGAVAGEDAMKACLQHHSYDTCHYELYH